MKATLKILDGGTPLLILTPETGDHVNVSMGHGATVDIYREHSLRVIYDALHDHFAYAPTVAQVEASLGVAE